MTEHTFWRVVAWSLSGAVAFVLLLGVLYGWALDDVARDCEKLGRFANGDRVFECSSTGDSDG